MHGCALETTQRQHLEISSLVLSAHLALATFKFYISSMLSCMAYQLVLNMQRTQYCGDKIYLFAGPSWCLERNDARDVLIKSTR